MSHVASIALALMCLSSSLLSCEVIQESKPGGTQVAPQIPGLRFSRPFPLDSNSEKDPLGDIPSTGVSFSSDDKFLQALYEAAEKVCRGNILRFPEPVALDILIEGSGYRGAWLETQPMGGHMWGKRDLAIARNNQMIFMMNQAADGQLPYVVKLDALWFGPLQGYCFPTPAWELYFLLSKDKEYLRRLYVALEGHSRYLWNTRDHDNNGCLEALSLGDTGEDGSSRYPDPKKEADQLPCYHESMDVMAYAYDGERVLASVSAELNNGREQYWNERSAATRNKLIEYLWRPEKHACYDRDRNNVFMEVLVHNNLRCMYHGIFTQRMADEFVQHHLLNPDEFWTPMPLPSIAVNDPKFKSVTHNNWSGQPQGLTYQRAIRALENYGHFAEVSLLGCKLIDSVGQERVFTQQFDPWTGKPNVPTSLRSSSYGPTALAVLEYIAHLYGIELLPHNNQIWFSGLSRPGKTLEYTQSWNARRFTLRSNSETFTGEIDGRNIFTCSANARVVTDLRGEIIQVVGISPSTQQVVIQVGDLRQKLSVAPNQRYERAQTGKFVSATSAPFDLK